MGSTFQYHLIPADGVSDTLAVQAVAIRFRTTASAIFDATRTADNFAGKAGTDDDGTSWHPGFGTMLVVPLPADALPAGGRVEWREVPASLRKATSFKALFDDLDKGGQLGVSNVKEERESVFHDWRNRNYREAASLRSPSGAGGGTATPAQTGPSAEVDCDAADILPDDKICVPLTKMFALGFPAAPSADAQSKAPVATIDLSASDVEELRKRLWGIDCACYNLMGLRKRAQQIQADCVKDLRNLLMVRALVHAIDDRNETSLKINPSFAKAGAARAKLLDDVDALVKKASELMLKSPQGTVDPKLSARWSAVLPYLQGLLKDKATIALVDRVLSTRGDLPNKQTPPRAGDKRTLVDAVCESVARAATWLADGPASDSTTALLDAAVTAMGSGSPPSPSAAKSLLDYVAGLPFVAQSHPAYGRDAPIAACGAIVNVFGGSKIMDGTSAGTEQDAAAGIKAKLEQAIEKIVLKKVLKTLGLPNKKCDLETYLNVTGEFYGVKDTDGGALGEAFEKGKEVKEKIDPARSWLDEPDADEDVKEAVAAMKTNPLLATAREKLTAFEEAHATLASLPGKVSRVSASVRFVVALTSVPKVAPGTDPDTLGQSPPRLEDKMKVVQAALDRTREQFEALKKLGVFADEAEDTIVALGRVSMLLGVLIEEGAAIDAIAGHDYMSAAAHGLQSAGQLLLLLGPETGGVTIIIGGILLAAGVILDGGKTLKELVTSHSEVLFKQYMEKFKNGSAGHFADLKSGAQELIDKVEQGIDGVGASDLLPPFSDMDVEAYGGDLFKAGFAPGEL